jgi:cell division septation protein DedD
MRDGNRLKEKIELRLDQRQATILVVVALLLALTLFSLGVMVGKNLATLPGRGPPSPEALLDRLDAKARPDAATDGLNFQEELTRRTPNPALSPPGAPAAIQPSSRSDPAVRAQPKVPDAGSKSAPVKVATATPTPTPTATPTPTPTATATTTTTTTQTQTQTATPTKTATKTAVVPSAPTAAPPTTAAIPPLPPPPEAPASAAASSGFTLQIKSTQSQDDADHFVRKLKGQGYHAFVVTADLPGKGRWYRVRLGKFDTRDAAEHYLQDFKREMKLNAFITAGGK